MNKDLKLNMKRLSKNLEERNAQPLVTLALNSKNELITIASDSLSLDEILYLLEKGVEFTKQKIKSVNA
jgi:hypothetical protein